jgi:hypothetical protein
MFWEIVHFSSDGLNPHYILRFLAPTCFNL